jgi:hypothetical protein
MPLPEAGTQEYEDMIDFMRADLESGMQYTKVEMVARKLIKERGDDFDEEFAKWRKNRLHIVVEEAGVDGCSGYKSPAECPHNGVFDPLSNACKECVEDAIIGYDVSDIL